MKKNKKQKFDESVHYTIKGRKRYKAKLWMVFMLMILVLLGCAAMFYFGNTTWDPEAGFTPVANPSEPYQVALIIIAAFLSVGAMVGTFLYCWFDIGKFYRSQMAYQKTKQFRDNKAKALNGNIYKLKTSTIKWYKKMGYITADEKRDILEKKKLGKTKPEK